MPPTVANSSLPRPDNSLGASGQGARACLQAALDANGHVPRKAVAQDVLGRDDESTFSKMTGGTRAFDLDHLDQLPRPIRVDWMKRYAEANGLHVREVEPAELTERVLGLLDELDKVKRLMDVRRPAALPAPLPESEPRKAVR